MVTVILQQCQVHIHCIQLTEPARSNPKIPLMSMCLSLRWILGIHLPFPSDRIRFYCPFNTGSYENQTGGGVTEHSMMIGWDYEPIDDRFGNFWKARYLMGVDEFMYWSDYDTISDDFTLASLV